MKKILLVGVAALCLGGCNVVVQERPVAAVTTYSTYPRPVYVPVPPPRPYYVAPVCRFVYVNTIYGVQRQRVCN